MSDKYGYCGAKNLYALSLSSNLHKVSASLVGGKAKMLMLLYRNKFNIPNGFVLTTGLFDYFIEHNSLGDALNTLTNLDLNKKKELCRKIRKEIIEGSFPDSITYMIRNYLKRENLTSKRIILRSSAETEDSATTSFAGLLKSIINITTFDSIIKSIKEIYASIFEDRVMEYCENFAIPIKKLRTAVILQELVDGDVSGVAFIDPKKNKKLIIEAVIGLNEGLVSGKITPSRIFVDLRDNKYSEFYNEQKLKVIANQNEGTRVVGNRVHVDTILKRSNLLSMAKIFKDIALMTGKPQDIEWTMANSALYILQSRDITVMPRFQTKLKTIANNNILHGYPASPGTIEGTVQIIFSEKEAIRRGNILVTRFTTMDFVPHIKLASAIVTEEGGLLSHGAIVAREFNKPCIVGVNGATKILKNGEKIVVDGNLGIIFRGEAKHQENIIVPEDELDWDTLLYFEKMKKMRINSKIIYYEIFPNKIIVYTKSKMGINNIKKSLKLVGDKSVYYGSKEKHFLYGMYLDNIKDKTTKKVYEKMIYDASTFSSNKLSLGCENCLRLSTQWVVKSKKIRAKTYQQYLKKLLALRRAYSIYILIDEYIAKGYAPYYLFENMKPVLKSLNMSFPDFLYKVDTGFGFSEYRLEKHLNQLVSEGTMYYQVLKYWHQNAYPLFAKIGAIGKKYSKEMDAIVASLNKIKNRKNDEDGWYLIALKH